MPLLLIVRNLHDHRTNDQFSDLGLIEVIVQQLELAGDHENWR